MTSLSLHFKENKLCYILKVNNLYLFAYYYWFYQLKESQSDTEISTSSYTVKLEERTLSEGYVNLRYGTDKSWITTFHFNMSNDDMRFSDLYTTRCMFTNQSVRLLTTILMKFPSHFR